MELNSLPLPIAKGASKAGQRLHTPSWRMATGEGVVTRMLCTERAGIFEARVVACASVYATPASFLYCSKTSRMISMSDSKVSGNSGPKLNLNIRSYGLL